MGTTRRMGGRFPTPPRTWWISGGPGPSGALFLTAAEFKRILGDPSSPIHSVPHRIYYVHAAQRLADLIIRIRRDQNAGKDTINIVAHSQGTEIAMLANFFVRKAGERAADCLIMCDSPYALEQPTMIEMNYPGRHQSADARVKTLTKFCQLMQANVLPAGQSPSDPDRITSKGVANQDAWSNTDNSRNNCGHVYNYFCPQDQVVSLPNILGMGWQGVTDEVKGKLGSNFYQRVFSGGRTVGGEPGTYVLGQQEQGEKPVAGVSLPADRTRTINGPKLPEPYTFEILSNTADPDYYGDHAGTALAQEGGPAPGESVADALEKLEKTREPWSQHSAINMSEPTAEKCMAYDVAVGQCVAFDNAELWRDLLRQADWRHEKNPDQDAKNYYSTGVLPPGIKRQMNKVRGNLPDGVINETVSQLQTDADDLGSIFRQFPPAAPLAFPVIVAVQVVRAVSSAITDVTHPNDLSIPEGSLWPNPKPDVEKN